MALPKIYTPNLGFSLIEILIVLLLLAITASLGLVVSFDSYRSYSFKSQENLLLGLLQKARGQAMANINQKPHGLYIDQAAKTFVLFQGDTYAHRDSDFDIAFPGNTNSNLSGANEIIFSQLSGNVANTGTISLNDAYHGQINIDVNNQGGINLH